jgi:hypothetical protein
VRDVDDGHAVGAQLRDQLEQALGLARRQRGGGLVHDEQARARAMALAISTSCFSATMSLAHLGARVDLQADLREHSQRRAEARIARRPAASPRLLRGRGRCSARRSGLRPG